jgi:hypothetical protein
LRGGEPWSTSALFLYEDQGTSFGLDVTRVAKQEHRGLNVPKFFRGDSAFAGPKLLRLSEKEGWRYAIPIKANAVLERHSAHLLRRPAGRPSHKPKVCYHSFRYQAGSWSRWSDTRASCSPTSASS